MSPRPRSKMRASIISLSAFSHMASAASSTIMMINPLASSGLPVVASIVNAVPSATTFAMGCGPNFPSQIGSYPSSILCPSLAALTITQGPSTVAYTSFADLALTPGSDPATNIKAALHCNLQGTTAAICTNSFDGLDKVVLPTQGLSPAEIADNQKVLDASKVPETFTVTGADLAFGRVVVTAGVEKLIAANSAAGSVASATGSGDKQAGMATSTPAVGAASLAGSASVTTNPYGEGFIGTGPAATNEAGVKFTSTSSGIAAKASNTTSAKATSTSKSSASVFSVANGFAVLVGALVTTFFL